MVDNFYTKPVVSFKDALILRKIRNEVAPYMTNNNEKIGYIQQFRFWKTKLSRKSSLNAYLAYAYNTPIGFLIMSKRFDSIYLTVGLLLKARGQGYGYRLCSVYVYAHDEVWLKVHEFNTTAIKLYLKLGFKFVSQSMRTKIITMKLEKGD